MPMLQGSKIGRSHPGKPFTFDSHQPQSHPRQQARQRHSCRTTPKSPQAAGATRRSCRPRPKVPAGSRRNAPQLPAALRSPPRRQAQSAEAAAGTRACNNHVPPHQPSGPNQQRPPSQAACSSVTAGGGRAWFSEHSADQCGALSAAPKEQDKAPHMVEDVLKTKPGPRRTGHTTRRAA